MKSKSLMKVFCILITLFISHSLSAQKILWQTCIGGSAVDNAMAFDIASDGCYMVAGSTRSYDVPDLDKKTGDADIMVSKVNAMGMVLWKKHFGGSFTDEARDIRSLGKEGFIIVGSTDSKEFTKGKKDFYVVRIDYLGRLLWQKSYGGSGNDEAISVVRVPDKSGFIIAGETGSQDGDVVGNHGGLDFWVIRINNTGEIVWKKTFGGTNNDQAYAMTLTRDNNIMVTGPTESTNGDIVGSKGKTDIFLVKMDLNGTVLQKKVYGGNGFDIPFGLTKSYKGELMMCGTTSSANGDIKSVNGANDAFVMALDDNGGMIWTKSYGGGSEDGASSIAPTFKGHYIIAGATSSRDGDLAATNMQGQNDAWFFKVDSVGNIIQNKTIGGNRNEQFFATKEAPSGDYVAIGYTSSDNADLEHVVRKGNNDYWIVGIEEPQKEVHSKTPTTVTGYIRDKKTKKFINAEVRIVNNLINKRVSSDKSDSTYGIYQVFLPDTNKASIGVFASGYIFFGTNITISPEQRYSETRLDVELEPIELGGKLNLFNIEFDLGSPKLRDNSYPELDRIVEFLNQNKTIHIQINGHTDGTGAPETKLKLSELRAQSVMKYLVSKGINQARLTAKGFGMKHLLEKVEDTPEKQQKNRRVEIQVTKK